MLSELLLTLPRRSTSGMLDAEFGILVMCTCGIILVILVYRKCIILFVRDCILSIQKARAKCAYVCAILITDVAIHLTWKNSAAMQF